MSFRSWLYVFALGLILAGSAQAQDQDAGPDNPTPPQQAQTFDLPNPFPVIIIESDEATKTRQAEESISRQREEDDLIAQQGMNASTKAMNEATQSMKWASWVAAGLVGAGTILLIWTLFLTRAASASAQEAVNVTREIGRDQSRAYVHIKDAELTWGGPKAESPNIRITVENTGQTPARWFEVVSHVVIEPLDEKGRVVRAIKFSEIDFSDRTPVRWPSLQGQRTCGHIIAADQELIRGAYQKSVAVTIFGIVRYKTFFDEVFETEFCYFRKSAPSYEHEVIKEDFIKTGGMTETNTIIREVGHPMSSSAMNLRAYEKVSNQQ